MRAMSMTECSAHICSESARIVHDASRVRVRTLAVTLIQRACRSKQGAVSIDSFHCKKLSASLRNMLRNLAFVSGRACERERGFISWGALLFAD